jgi:hypothetical protein
MAGGRSRAIAVAAAAAVLLYADSAFAQCAMCRLALHSPEGERLIGALRQGIAVLLVAPFAVFGVVAALAVRGRRRNDQQQPGD